MITFECPANININAIKESLDDVNGVNSLYFMDTIDTNIYIISAKYKKYFYYMELYDYYKIPYPGDKLFRAFCGVEDDEIFIFVDDSEITNSIQWLVIHELIHRAILSNRLLYFYMYSLKERYVKNTLGYNNIQDYRKNLILKCKDEIHENEPEEKFCNEVATVLCSGNYGRAWWRKRHIQLEHWNINA